MNRDPVQFNIDHGTEFPYHGRKPKDKAEVAALGVLADLCDRRGIRQELDQVDDDIRPEIVEALSAIIRKVYEGQP